MERIERNKNTVLQLIDAMNEGDGDTARTILSPDTDWWVLGLGTFDRDTILEMMFDILKNATGGIKVTGMTAEGERVAVEAESRFEFADGRVYANSYHQLFIIRDDQVVAVKEYLDTAVAARFFGQPTA